MILGKKKKEHVTFDRMADKPIRINKKSFIDKNIKYKNSNQGKVVPQRINDRLSSIYWIGGSPCCGKSTIAEMLVEEYGFELYKCDDYLDRYTDIGFDNGDAIMKKIKSMNIDETWLRDVNEQVEDEFEFYRQALKTILEDLQNNYKENNILVEGAAILPEFVEKLGIDKNHYICIVPIKKFQIEKYSKREWVKHYLASCSDPVKAFENWMERDAKYAEIVSQKAKDCRLNNIIVDGNSSVEENYLRVKQLFQLV